MSVTSIANDTLGRDSFVNSQKPVPPTITGYTISGSDDTALDPAGGQTILLNGTGFQRGATVTIDGSAISVVSFIGPNQLSFTSTAKGAGTYTIYVVNADLGTAIYVPGLIYSNLPTWSTSAGSLGSYYETKAISNTLTASGDAPVTYSLVSGSLPTGASLNSSGVISGTAPVDSGSTTYSFTVEAIDAQLQGSTRSFSLTINTDVVTWGNPSNGATITLDGTAYSNVLSATSTAGYGISSYTANALPTGLTLTGDTISGVPSVEGNTTTLLTATSSTTNRSRTNTITWVVNLGDSNWKYVTTLLSPTLASYPFNDDASTNNFVVTVTGDTKPNNFNPYLTGWSNQFDGTGDYLAVANNSSLLPVSGTDFTAECWIYVTGATNVLAHIFGMNSNLVSNWTIKNENGSLQGSIGNVFGTFGAAVANTWVHLALVQQSNTMVGYLNGVQAFTSAITTWTNHTLDTTIGARSGAGDRGFTGHISNARVVKGTAVYTSNFIPPTNPLTAITNTSLLTCQSNRIIDNSTNNFTITRNGDVAVRSFSPFTEPASTNGSGYFDGTGDYLTAPANTSLTLGTSDYTVECWVYLQGTQTTTYGWGVIGTYPGAGGGWSITINRSQGSQGIAWILNNSIVVDYTGAYIPTNIWTHIAISRSGSGTNNTKIFLNGVMVNQATDNTNDTFSGLTYIGGQGTGQLFTGYIADARVVKGTAVYTANFTPPASPLTAITNTSLLTCQTNQPVNNNVFLDSSTNNLVVTRAGNTTQGTFSPYGENWSNYFDGNGDYLSLASNAAFDQNTAFTVECWVNSSAGGYFFTQLNSGYLGLNYDASTRKIVVDKSYVGVQITSTNSFAFNQWHHVAMSYNGTTTRLFVNGALEGSAAGGGSASGAELRIGNYNVGSNFYTGYISNLRICKSALYTSNFTPSTTPLQPIAGTSLLTCRDPNFVDDSPNNFTITRTGDVSVQKFGPFAGTTLPTPYYSAYFDGSGDYLTTAVNTAFDMGTGDFTIECFTISNGYSGSQYGRGLWVLYTAGNYNNRVLVRHSNVGQILGIYGNTGSTTYFGTSGTGGTTNLVVGQWYHVAFVRQSGVFRLYVNGVQEIVVSNQTGISLAGLNCFDIGRCQDGSTPDWNGYISNFRAIKGTCLYPDGTTFTPPASPLTAVSGTGILTCRSNTFVDSSSNAIALTVSGTPSPRTATPFSVTYSTKQSYTPAVFGGSMYFDGTGDYLSSPSNAAIGTGPFTIECWIYPTALGTLRQIVYNAYWQVGNNGGYRLSLAANNTIQLYASTGTYNTFPMVISSSAALASVNQWYHIAVVRNSSNSVMIYINGVAAATAVTYASSLNLGSGQTLKVGVAISDGGVYDPFLGYISDLRIISGSAIYPSSFVPQNRPLTPVTNTTLLLSGTGAGIYDSSEMNNYETVADVKLSHFGPYNGSYYSNYFDGTGDYLTVPNNTGFAFGSGSFTVEMWVYITGTTGTVVNYSNGQSSNSNFAWELYQVSSSTIQFSVFQGATQYISSSTSFLLNTWNHIACVRNSNTLTTYVNGVAGATTANLTGVTISDPASSTLKLCSYGNGSSYVTGYISNLRIVKGTAVYTSAFTPPTSPLTAIANTSLLTCQSNKFVDNSTNNFTITRVGDTRVATQNPFQINSGQSIIFDGTGDYLTTYDPSYRLSVGTGDFTFECWAYVNSMPSVVTAFYHLKNDAALATTVFAIELSPAGALGLSTGTSVIASGTTGRITVNNWIHIAVVRTSGVLKTFINGTQDISISNTTTYNGTYLQIGAWRYNTYDYSLNGCISDFRITKGIARYTANFTPPTSSFSTK